MFYGDLGGYIGFLLGVSVITVLEIFDWVLMKVKGHLQLQYFYYSCLLCLSRPANFGEKQKKERRLEKCIQQWQ